MSTRPQPPLGPDSPTTEKDRTMDDEAKKRIRRLEGQLIAQRAFIGLALANPTRDHVEAVFETPALVKFYVDEPETSEIPKIVAEGFAYEKSRLKHHYDSFKDAYARRRQSIGERAAAEGSYCLHRSTLHAVFLRARQGEPDGAHEDCRVDQKGRLLR